MRVLADDIGDVFGQITPPAGVGAGDPQVGLSQMLSLAIKLFILISAVLLLAYMLWGALDWITSGGDKEKITKARNKITHAAIGMFLVIFALTVFSLITGDILGIIKGWQIQLPTAP